MVLYAIRLGVLCCLNPIYYLDISMNNHDDPFGMSWCPMGLMDTCVRWNGNIDIVYSR
jgi:hypothetical protein